MATLQLAVVEAVRETPALTIILTLLVAVAQVAEVCDLTKQADLTQPELELLDKAIEAETTTVGTETAEAEAELHLLEQAAEAEAKVGLDTQLLYLVLLLLTLAEAEAVRAIQVDGLVITQALVAEELVILNKQIHPEETQLTTVLVAVRLGLAQTTLVFSQKEETGLKE
jgi:hypothetical protein